jgi:hypothetical protein
MNLTELAAKYGTDKHEHGYMPFYEAHLPQQPGKILEIGVKQGASMRMWREAFPQAELHGMDLFMEFQPPDDIPGVRWWKGHQCDYYLLEELLKQDFDVIIDDGSHASRHQLMTFFGLFNGKHYFIEDLHCCEQPFYQQGLPYNFTADNILRKMPKFNVIFDTKFPITLIKNIP